MPLRDFKCIDCGHVVEYLIRSDADVPSRCEQCGSEKIEQQVSAHGGYFGNFGPSSVTPRSSGSFKRPKK